MIIMCDFSWFWSQRQTVHCPTKMRPKLWKSHIVHTSSTWKKIDTSLSSFLLSLWQLFFTFVQKSVTKSNNQDEVSFFCKVLSRLISHGKDFVTDVCYTQNLIWKKIYLWLWVTRYFRFQRKGSEWDSGGFENIL